MSEQEIKMVADRADMIIDGFSYTVNGDQIRVLDLNNTENACVLNKAGDMMESSMSDAVLFKAQALYLKNKELLEV